MSSFVTVLDPADDPCQGAPITGKRSFNECRRVSPGHATRLARSPSGEGAAECLGGVHNLDAGNPVGEYPLDAGFEGHG